MSKTQKWAIGIAASLSVAGMVTTGVVVVEMVLGTLHAMREFAHAFDGAVSW